MPNRPARSSFRETVLWSPVLIEGIAAGGSPGQQRIAACAVGHRHYPTEARGRVGGDQSSLGSRKSPPASRRKRRLRQAKEEWEQTYNTVPDLVAILDDQRRIVRANPRYGRAAGRDA